MKPFIKGTAVSAVALLAMQGAIAGTDIYFNPLTHSATVAAPNHLNELNNPWVVPAGISLYNLTSMDEIEADMDQSVVRAPGQGTSASMWDMLAYDPSGEYIFIPHESPIGAGVSRYSILEDKNEVLFAGDSSGNWANDYGAFDPARWTPMGTVIAGEEWSGEGRVIEILNPMANPADIKIREAHEFANVSHEGIVFSSQYKDVVYYVDENNSGSIYKLVLKDHRNLSKGGQTFVLVVNDFAGEASANYNSGANIGQPRTGYATWVPITDKKGVRITTADPFAPGTNSGRFAADEVKGTPYGRPEDGEVGKLRNGREVFYFAATSENTIYSVEIINSTKAKVGVLVNADSPKNVGFLPTTGVLNAPDNLAQDALGNIYIIEDAPNNDAVGGDIWFVRDADNDGVAESLDHFMSVQVGGSEATGMIFSPTNPTEFVVAVQHPASTHLDNVPNGMGDAMWSFDLSDVVPPTCSKYKKFGGKVQTCSSDKDFSFVNWLEYAGYKTKRHHKDKR